MGIVETLPVLFVYTPCINKRERERERERERQERERERESSLFIHTVSSLSPPSCLFPCLLPVPAREKTETVRETGKGRGTIVTGDGDGDRINVCVREMTEGEGER